MIRLPPTTITLGSSDIKDFERRQRRHHPVEEEEIFLPECLPLQAGSTDGLFLTSLACKQGGSQQGENHSTWDGDECHSHLHSLPARIARRPRLAINPAIAGRRESPSPASTEPLEEYITVSATPSEDEYGYSPIGVKMAPEETASEMPHYRSPVKDDFHYGGFIETPVENVEDKTGQQLPLFAPGDISTPYFLHPPGTQRRRIKASLPGSPLVLCHHASSSPDHRRTPDPTPRGPSRVASHHTPGMLFAQPPRRPPHRTRRRFRHQTNSFSFDESERSSVAYEHGRESSTSTTSSVPRPSDNLSLHEELRGSSLQSSKVNSNRSSSPPDRLHEIEVALALPNTYERPHTRGVSYTSTPNLLLPSPFSAVSRSVSNAESLPSAIASEHTLWNPPNSPVSSPSISPRRILLEARPQTPVLAPPTVIEQGERVASLPPSNSGNSPRSLLRSATRLLTSYRSRSPLSLQASFLHESLSMSVSPTPRRSRMPRFSAFTNPALNQTPSRSYNVYKDSLSPASQPQTPAHLPEARHQSRYHPSYTTPVTATTSRLGELSYNNGDGVSSTAARNLSMTIATPSRRGGRSVSPAGLLDEGFRGLYGGVENGDEEQIWVDGIRAGNAEVRLWGLREARRDGRSLSETPEREDWRTRRE